jgi:hypothetical protein
MPYVSLFFGIIIRMFHNELNPPHFHAEYQGQRGVFDFDGNMSRGSIRSNTAKRLIHEWANLHRAELLDNWERATRAEQLDKIALLD